jgi:uncharacterized integral membrane protein
MSAAPEKPDSTEPTTASDQPKKERASRRDQGRTIAWVLLAVIITVFAVLNTREVTVDWIVGSGHAPLIIVIAISLLVGILLTYLADRRSRKRH